MRDADAIYAHGEALPLILGTLFEKLLGVNGGTPEGHSHEEWLAGCRVPGPEIRDWLRDIAMDYGFDWKDMELHPKQAEWLGLKDDPTEPVSP